MKRSVSDGSQSRALFQTTQHETIFATGSRPGNLTQYAKPWICARLAGFVVRPKHGLGSANKASFDVASPDSFGVALVDEVL